MNFLSAQELKAKMDVGQNLFLLDVRENYERVDYSIPSHHIPMAEVWDRTAELPASEPVVVICRSGKRAEAVANLLETGKKINNLWILEGGITAWMETVDLTSIAQ
jgi:rhodanese-related sulfurtransferase